MPTTYTLIASNTLSSSAATVTFSAIPNTFTDLVLKWSARSDRTGNDVNAIRIRFNSTTSLYSSTELWNIGGSAGSSRNSSTSSISGMPTTAADATSNTFASGEIYLPSYLVSQNKPLSGFNAAENNSSSSYQINAVAGLWRYTNAITDVEFASSGFNFVSGSSFFLYGIKNS